VVEQAGAEREQRGAGHHREQHQTREQH